MNSFIAQGDSSNSRMLLVHVLVVMLACMLVGMLVRLVGMLVGMLVGIYQSVHDYKPNNLCTQADANSKSGVRILVLT